MAAYQTRTVNGRTQVKRGDNAWYYVDETTGLPELKWVNAYWEVKRSKATGSALLCLMQSRKQWWGGTRDDQMGYTVLSESADKDEIIYGCLYILSKMDREVDNFMGKYPPKNINEVEEK